MKKFHLLITSILLLFLANQAHAECQDWCPELFLSPGIKLGYTFGKNGGFNIGSEFSLGSTVGVGAVGLVSGIQYNFKQESVVFYHEIEGIIAYLGLATGIEYDVKEKLDFRIRLFGGLGGYASFKFDTSPGFETSLVGKFPFFYEYTGDKRWRTAFGNLTQNKRQSTPTNQNQLPKPWTPPDKIFSTDNIKFP